MRVGDTLRNEIVGEGDSVPTLRECSTVISGVMLVVGVGRDNDVVGDAESVGDGDIESEPRDLDGASDAELVAERRIESVRTVTDFCALFELRLGEGLGDADGQDDRDMSEILSDAVGEKDLEAVADRLNVASYETDG